MRQRIVIEEGEWRIQKKPKLCPVWITIENFTMDFDTAMAKIGWRKKDGLD